MRYDVPVRVRCLLLLVLPAVLPVAGCAPAADEDPGPQRPASWTAELGTAPTLLALTPEAALAASYGNGVGGSQVYRVDRATGRKVAQRTLAGQPHGLALSPTGELWLATLQLPDQPSGTGLQVLDPVSLQTRRALQVEGVPLSVAFVGDQLWVGAAGGVRQVDPHDGAVLREVRTQVPANRLVVLGSGLLVVGPDGLQRVDTAAAVAGPPRPLPASGSVLATGGDDRLWVVHPDAQDAAVLRRLDPRTLVDVTTAASPGRAGAVAFAHRDRLWVTDPGGGRLLCLDGGTGAVRREQDLVVTGPVVADGETVVAAQSGGLAAVPADCPD